MMKEISDSVVNIFDRTLYQRFLSRASHKFHSHSLLHEIASKTTDDFLKHLKYDFKKILIYGYYNFHHKVIVRNEKILAHHSTQLLEALYPASILGERLTFDEEQLPFAANEFDLAVSNLTLHFVNDVPGVLTQYLRILKPGGLFIANFLGGNTLHELRSALATADQQYNQGVYPRVIPMINIQSATHLMQRAGFKDPVVNTERVTIEYQNLKQLFHDLRFSGLGNCMFERTHKFSGKHFFLQAEESYCALTGSQNQRLPATFDFITLLGSKLGS